MLSTPHQALPSVHLLGLAMAAAQAAFLDDSQASRRRMGARRG